jgi:ribosomal protein S19E (S16A)
MTTAVEFKKISPGATALLRRVRIAGGSLDTRGNLGFRDSVQELKKAGYVQIKEDYYTIRLTGHGQAHLDRLMRAH